MKLFSRLSDVILQLILISESWLIDAKHTKLSKPSSALKIVTNSQIRCIGLNPHNEKQLSWLFLTQIVRSQAESSEKNRVDQKNPHLELARAFARTLQAEEITRLSDRVNRWRSSLSEEEPGRLTGNAANAKQAADKRADSVSPT